MDKLHIHHMNNKQDGIRGFLHYYGKGENKGTTVDLQWQIIYRKQNWKEWGFYISLGDRGSETPIDLYFSAFGLASFFGMRTPRMGQFCEWIGRGHKRRIELRTFGGQLWWNLWYDDDSGMDVYHKCDGWRKPKLYPWRWGREKHRPWMCLRDGNIDINPLDAIWGGRLYSYEDLDVRENQLVSIGQYHGDVHEVTFKLQKQTQGRRHGFWPINRVSDRGYVADWRCDKGIPTRNHSWKGDCTIASAVHVDGGEDWLIQAVQKLRESIKKDRERHNFNPEYLGA